PKEVGLRHRFGQVISSTEAHSGTDVALLALSRKKDERNGLCLWRAAQGSNDTEPIELRHNYLRKNEVRLFLFSQLDTNAAVLSGERLKLLQLQDRRQVATHLCLALDYQNLLHDLIFQPCYPLQIDFQGRSVRERRKKVRNFS